ncbi:DUF1189 domain-containing protein [Bacillus mangrovi]|uniref:DUF1189 domain-containing protein n=1 Tax=Metabacillus mangrovi TaxID=1491830 RepID=A0A7X2S380_9BACI|nr:DUF1189 domain-containing protein [Metabacillus mangrovi]MTH52435.1 DUF1189 domain-containing protein [Metabacillus mangrovi]
MSWIEHIREVKSLNLFKQFIKSLYSPRDIASFRFQGIGKSILYVFLLCLLSIVPASVYGSIVISGGIAAAEKASTSLPDFTIQNGQLTAETDKPVEMKQGDIILVLDPTGTFTRNEIEQKQNAIGILKDEFVFATNGISQVLPYSGAGDIAVNKDQLVSLAQQAGDLQAAFIGGFVFILYLISSFSKFVEVTVLALLGLIIRNMLRKKISFKQSWVMAAYAVTLATIFFTVMSALQASVPSQGLVLWFVHVVILYLAVKEVPSKKEPEVIV